MTVDADEAVQDGRGARRRQPAPEISPGWVFFDVLFGVALPLLCLLFDPIFKPTGSIDLYWMYGYVGISVVGLLVWLFTRWSAAFLAGFFVVAAACAACMGVVLLPLSLVAFPIGALGFIPLVTSFVYLRNAWRAWRANPRNKRLLGGLAGLAFGLAPLLYPMYGRALVVDAVALARSGNEPELDHAVVRIRSMPIPINMDPLVWAYIEEDDSAPARERLAETYEQITGDDIEGRAHRLARD